ncbi:hypothetical protein GF412_03375 [Candidatus Micrarchaeota archaeon]|nr:hypothetical protein [Candidatus Micrarchaeota archaeon]MBD3417993.1 hypothetical protein [Candidatus Micrarchaeota archaeon]
MAEAMKKKPEETYPMNSTEAVERINGMETFQRAQYQEVLNAVMAVEAYLSKVQSGEIPQDKTFRENIDKLLDIIEPLRNRALEFDMQPKAPAGEGPSIVVPRGTFADIAVHAQGCWETISTLTKKEREEERSKLGLTPRKAGEEPEAYTPKAAELPLPQAVVTPSPGTYTTQEVPDQIRKYLTTDEQGNYNEAQLNALREDLGNILTGYYNERQSLTAQGGTSLWNHLMEFTGSEQSARACVAGAKPQGMSDAEYNQMADTLVNQLKNGQVDELLEGQYPISEALRNALEYNTVHYENARVALSVEALWWLAEHKKFRLGVKGGVNIWQMEVHEDGTLRIIDPETGQENVMPVDETKTEWLVGGKALAVFELELSEDLAAQIEAGSSYDVRQILPDREQIWTGDVKVKLLGSGGITDRGSLGNYVLSIGGSFGEDYQKYLAKGEGTLTVFPASKSGHFVGIYGLASAVRETGEGGLFEINYNALQLALGPKVDFNLLESGVRGRLSITAAPTIILYTNNPDFMDLSSPEQLWGGIFGVHYKSGEVEIPNFTLGASVTEAPEGMEGPPVTGGAVLSIEF